MGEPSKCVRMLTGNAGLLGIVTLPVLVLLMFLCAPAAGSPITLDITFSASGFGAGAPVDPVVGSFVLTIDPASSYTNQAVASYSLPGVAVTGGVVFDWPYAGTDLVIGGSLLGASTVQDGTDDFWLYLAGPLDSLSFGTFLYSKAGAAQDWYTSNGTVGAVPLGPSWLLFGSGLIPLAWARRKKRWGK
jgi:hypothetical protein